MLLAADSSSLPLWLYSTLPLWPLAGAVLVGLILMGKKRADAAAASHGSADGHDSGGHSHGHGQHPDHGRSHGHGGHDHAHGGAAGHPIVVTAAHWPVLLGVGAAAIIAVLMFFQIGSAGHAHHPSTPAVASTAPSAIESATAVDANAAPNRPARQGFAFTAFNWISLGATRSLDKASDQWIGLTFYFDGLTGIMMIVVCLVALMVVIYSTGYMRDHHGHPERGYERFFAFLALFVFSMAVLVLAGNFVLLYMGWELVGLCSYLLIGFYYGKPEAAAAAKKAFIVNRIGDFGFALGIFALYAFLSPLCGPGENPLDYTTLFKYAGELTSRDFGGMSQATVVALLLLCGALGKSAQFPLYVWLPDAMEGPSPVSALIHAATMVTAGVYMMARLGPLFAFSETARHVVLALGVIGAVLAATMAMAQYDMKRILAYSTMSQLAFMFVAVGCQAPDSAVFHLYTHAFFKALLFLCAGSVMHAMGNVIDLRQFSGLRTVLPTTQKLMLIGCLALAGFPLLSGFWSKDEIIHSAWEFSPYLGVVMLATAAMTAYYTFRMYFLCFHGPTRLPPAAGDHPHDSPPVMNGPLVFLAIGAVAAGLIGVSIKTGGFLGLFAGHGWFHHYLEFSSIVRGPMHEGGYWLMYLSSAVAIVSIYVAYLRYGQAPTDEPDRRALGSLWNLWNAKYYVDEAYDVMFVRPLRATGRAFFSTDNNVINGVIFTVAAVPSFVGWMLGGLQRGALQGYALCMVLGIGALLVVWRMTEGGGG